MGISKVLEIFSGVLLGGLVFSTDVVAVATNVWVSSMEVVAAANGLAGGGVDEKDLAKSIAWLSMEKL